MSTLHRWPRSLAGKPLAGFRATPSRRNPVLYGMVVYGIRFRNPLLHRQSTLRKRRLGENRVSGQTSRSETTSGPGMPVRKASGSKPTLMSSLLNLVQDHLLAGSRRQARLTSGRIAFRSCSNEHNLSPERLVCVDAFRQSGGFGPGRGLESSSRVFADRRLLRHE